MPVRIYALAKQLKIDNQSLIDACTKAGITVKGSALASLSDDEVAQVKAFLSGKGSGSASQETAAGAKGTTRVAPGAGKTAVEGGALRREDYIAPGGAVPRKVPVLKRPERPQSAQTPPGETPQEGAPPLEKDAEPEKKQKAERPGSSAPAIKLARMPEAQQPTP
ncbi:MAG: hypothetical protein ABIP48_27625, partial [Planctomycetota bacterium]